MYTLNMYTLNMYSLTLNMYTLTISLYMYTLTLTMYSDDLHIDGTALVSCILTLFVKMEVMHLYAFLFGM